MNKTITINLGGVVFNIEEDAFNELKDYLERLKSRFTSDEGSEEITADIEARMAELLKEKLNENKTALTLSDIDSVITIMGNPEDYGDFSEPKSKSNPHTNFEEGNMRSKNRKLYRDEDDAVIGGVCSGLSHFLGWDPSIARIVLVLAVIFGGTGILLYIILWAVVPAAKTRAEKLQMKGEPVTVENISKMVKDEMDKFESNVSGKSKKFGAEFSGKAREFGQNTGRVFEVIIGGLLTIIALGMLISITGGLVGLNIGGPFASDNFSLSYADKLLFNGDGSLTWLVVSGSIMVIAPVFLLIYAGIKLLLGIKTKIPGLGWSLLVLFLLGLSASIFLGLNVGKNFAKNADNTTTQEINITSDTLHVGVLDNPHFLFDIESEDREFFELIKETENTRIYGEPIYLHFESTDEENYSVIFEKTSNGSSTTDAFQLIEKTEYNYNIQGDSINFDTYFSTPLSDPYRCQEIRITVTVPRGKWISFGNGLQRIYWRDSNIGKIRQMGEADWMEKDSIYRPNRKQNNSSAI
ncbi:MAG: PspC domain-containing protein [Flavobacteriales bacterium]|nr:PspC domain-containing protein [Flavobacteriales bacterium]